jgi:hypothetical protein
MPHTTLILAVLSRDTHLYRVPGFLEFHLLRGPERDDHMLYSSHTVWASKAAFTGWPQSEHFRAPIVTPAPTSRSISAIPSSRASRQSRRSRIQMHHLLFGEAQNGGAIALAGRPGSLEAIDRRLGSAKDSSRPAGSCEAPRGRGSPRRRAPRKRRR